MGMYWSVSMSRYRPTVTVMIRCCYWNNLGLYVGCVDLNVGTIDTYIEHT